MDDAWTGRIADIAHGGSVTVMPSFPFVPATVFRPRRLFPPEPPPILRMLALGGIVCDKRQTLEKIR